MACVSEAGKTRGVRRSKGRAFHRFARQSGLVFRDVSDVGPCFYSEAPGHEEREGAALGRPCGFAWDKAGTREEFVRVHRNENGGLDLYSTQNSQILASCAWADGLADIPAGAVVKPGDVVNYYPFRDLFL